MIRKRRDGYVASIVFLSLTAGSFLAAIAKYYVT